MEKAPESFFCPIDYTLMVDPVMIVDTGQTYCRACITHWFEDHDTCPYTSLRVPGKSLTPNHALRNAIDEYKHKHCKLIPSSCVSLHEMIGRGSFKVVHRASLSLPGASRAMTVAALVVQTGDISAEVSALLKLNPHPCLVTFIGQCDDSTTTTTTNTERILLTEFARGGALDEFIGNLDDAGESLSLNHKLAILQQVISGMDALTLANLVHRDLACRNILVFIIDMANVSKTHIKISDFGLALDMYRKSYVRVDGGALPLRWMSPEALDKGRFSTKSDVWAFGVLAFELLSDGRIPYVDVVEDNVRAHIMQRNMLTCPRECTFPQLWNIVKTCWEFVPNNRPSFHTLGVSLGQLHAHLPNTAVGVVEHVPVVVDVPAQKEKAVTTPTPSWLFEGGADGAIENFKRVFGKPPEDFVDQVYDWDLRRSQCNTIEKQNAIACMLVTNAKVEGWNGDLYLYWNNIGDEGAKSLGEGVKHSKTLKKLFLNYNNIGDEGAKFIGEGVKHSKTLKMLDLDNNDIGDEGAKFIGEFVKHSKTLETLVLYSNSIGDKGTKFIGEGVKHSKTLKMLDLRDNNLTAAAKKRLQQVGSLRNISLRL